MKPSDVPNVGIDPCRRQVRAHDCDVEQQVAQRYRPDESQQDSAAEGLSQAKARRGKEERIKLSAAEGLRSPGMV